MKRVLIIGTSESRGDLLKATHAVKQMEVVAFIVAYTNHTVQTDYHIPTDTDWKRWLYKDIDAVIETTGDPTMVDKLLEAKETHTTIIPAYIATMFLNVCHENETLRKNLATQKDNQSLLLNHIRDGMIVINTKNKVEFANTSTEHILETSKNELENKHIESVVKNSRLPHVLKSKQKEINQRLVLENGKTVVTTRMPIINSNNELQGAFSVFKDITEVQKLAEDNTDLTEIKTMLEAIIHSSEEAISVVDENGLGIMINPAYTRITGLTEDSVIGHPATVDIFEGKSVHMKVLKTRKPIRGVRMKVGVTKKDVLVNVAPIIVGGQIKGSVGVLHDISEMEALTRELKKAREIIRNLEAKYTFADVIGESPEMDLALQQAKVGAKTPATVLLRGESGTGKELFAHAIHNESDRKHHKFLRINCAALSQTEIEKELFGFESASHTEAHKKGLFEEANQGSVFLDEIGRLSLNLQIKLLRVLQENEIVRVGGTIPIAVNVRVITATNINLEKAIMQKAFREDLYYLLNRLPIFIPSLRERYKDIPDLAKHIIKKTNREYGKNVHSISYKALQELSTYNWPGNIRELENVIGRAMIYMKNMDREIKRSHLPSLHVHTILRDTFLPDNDTEIASLQQAVEGYEKEYISRVLKQYNYNKTKTAKALHISVRNLYYKMDKYQLETNF